jgi:hypothetical protein
MSSLSLPSARTLRRAKRAARIGAKRILDSTMALTGFRRSCSSSVLRSAIDDGSRIY